MYDLGSGIGSACSPAAFAAVMVLVLACGDDSASTGGGGGGTGQHRHPRVPHASSRLGLAVALLVVCGAFLLLGCSEGDSADNESPTGSAGSTAGAGAGGGDDPEETPVPVPVPEPEATPVGTPIAPEEQAVIGAAGGTLTTGDGLVTVVVPPGAVATDTTFGIQLLSNEWTSGVGPAYRLTPDGAQFAVPVELRFKYDERELDGTTPAWLGVAFQDDGGFWRWMEGAADDAEAKETVVPTTHFTDFIRVPGKKLIAGHAVLEPASSTFIRLHTCHGPHADAELEYLTPCDLYQGSPGGAIAPISWTILGVPDGNMGDTRNGTLVVTTEYYAHYIAPEVAPESGAVRVAAWTVDDPSKDLKVTIRITDASYVVDVDDVWLMSTYPCSSAWAAYLVDHSEFEIAPFLGALAARGVKNTTTAYGPPFIDAFKVTVTTEPIYLDLDQVTVSELQGGQIKVEASTSTRTGACTLSLDGQDLEFPSISSTESKLAFVFGLDPALFDARGQQKQEVETHDVIVTRVHKPD